APARGAKGPDELGGQIERTRHELGDTVEQLAGKMDVKGRARARAEDLRDKAGAMSVQLRSSATQAGRSGLRHPRPVLIAGAAAGAGVAAGVVLLRQGSHLGSGRATRGRSSLKGRAPAGRSCRTGRAPAKGHGPGPAGRGGPAGPPCVTG